MRFDVISLFPAMFAALQQGVTGRVLTRGLAELVLWNPRDYAINVHGQVDDRPYGGGPGMLMRYEPLAAAIQAARSASPGGRVLYLSPQGQPFTQAAAREFARSDSLILLAGRYEGIDERLLATQVDEVWSVGDYVVSGGELPAMLIIDSIIRLLPGALGHMESARQDSFSTDLLDHPHYTRPEVIAGQAVPDVLLSGDHARICRWRLQQSLGRTWQQRPDLLQQRLLSDEEQILLAEFISDMTESSQPTGPGASREQHHSAA
ncbi:MAG: tRNA (guanosine(37)-N1)-methyltransferase TrmD [Pseudomonadota bacterium]